MFTLATRPNVEVGLLGTGPCYLIASGTRGGNWGMGGLLGQLYWTSLIRHLRPHQAGGMAMETSQR
jgi:hypothetical protein